jgi:ribosome maturation factor RimP
MQTALEQQIYDALIDTLKDLGFDIVRLRILDGGSDVSRNKVLEVLIERLDGVHISVKDCRSASHHISAILDVEDMITSNYNLEVSSAGVERPLVKLADFMKYKDYVILIKLQKAVNDSKKYQGTLLGVEGDDILLEVPKDKAVIKLDFANIKEAKLVLTEELFRKIIK